MCYGLNGVTNTQAEMGFWLKLAVVHLLSGGKESCAQCLANNAQTLHITHARAFFCGEY
jgi:hypothetical protein